MTETRTNIDDGGAAYPSIRNVYDGGSGSRAEAHGGLTKREAFAMEAMGALLSVDHPRDTAVTIAKASVMMADALLAALRGDANV